MTAGLRKLRNKNRPLWRKTLFVQQGGLCAICEEPLPDPDVTPDGTDPYRNSFDHIIPQCRGGSSDLENLQLAHQRCNQRKDGLIDWSMYPCDHTT